MKLDLFVISVINKNNDVYFNFRIMSTAKDKPLYDAGLCRCCGNLKKCRLINTEYVFEGKNEVYSDMIWDCFGLLLTNLDGKPMERLICATCVLRLREALAFRKQVTYWEEALLQMKMNMDEEPRVPKTMKEINELFDGPPKLELDEVKEEPNYDEDINGADDTSMTCDESEDLQLLASRKHNDNQSVETKNNVPRVKVKTVRKINQLKQRKKAIIETEPDVLPMSELQQIHREKDPTYKIESNLLTIIELSYVCPFRCRHNNLLCYYCGGLYTDPEQLRQHTLTHTPKKFKVTEHKNMVKMDITRIDCRLCTAKINDLEDFKRHVVNVHNKKYYFEHPDSVLPFKLKSGELKCALCDVIFLYFHALNKHMNEHFNNYVCETCGLGFVDKGRFVMHQIRHENTNFPCEVCGKIFKAQYNKDLHVDRVHKKKGRVYCPKCDIKLMSYAQKLKHLVEVHGEEPLSFSCHLCRKVFDKRRTLTIHVRKEHLKDYRYECQCCGQKFFTRFALTNHMPVHTGERNFKCKVCDKSYPRLKTLKDHMRIHTNDRRYRCDVCGQAFIQNCSLKAHIKSQHAEYG